MAKTSGKLRALLSTDYGKRSVVGMTSTSIGDFAGPPVPDGFAAEMLAPISIIFPQIIAKRTGYKNFLLAINPEARSLHDFVRLCSPLPVDSYNAMRFMVYKVLLRMRRVGPRLPPRFAAEMIKPIADWVPLIVSSDPIYKERLASISPRARGLNDFLHARSPLPVDSYNALRRLVRFVKWRMNFVGPLPPKGFVKEILSAWAKPDVAVRAIGEHPFLRRKAIRQINSEASSFDDFFAPLQRKIYSHNAFRSVVDDCMGSLIGPPLPPWLAREILQPLVDQSIDLERAGMNIPEFARWLSLINRNIPNPKKSLADIYYGETPCALASYNCLRKLTRIIIQNANSQRNIARKHAALQASLNPPIEVSRTKQTLESVQIDGRHPTRSNQNAEGIAIKKGARGHLHVDPAGTGLQVRLATSAPPTEAEWQSMREAWDF